MSRSGSFLLDTHVWIRYQAQSRLLRPNVVHLIDEAVDRSAIWVSIISVWELALLERDGRLAFDGGLKRWSSEALAKPGVNLLPLSPSIAIEAVHLPEPMHKDPSDRFLVASARVENMTLVTSDKAIIRFARNTGLTCLKA